MRNEPVNNTNAVRTERGKVESKESNGVTKGHAEVHNTRLYFERAGAGRTLVLIHAGIADHRMWDTQFHTLADNYDVIRYDLRGYGKSNVGREIEQEQIRQNGNPSDDQNYSHAQDLYQLLRTLGVEGATLIGASLGGEAAIEFALEQPTMTKGLVLVCAVPSGYEFTGDIPQAYTSFQTAMEQDRLDRATELATQIWFDGPQRQPEQMDTDLRDQVKMLMGNVLAGSTLNFSGENAAAKPAINRLGEIEIPTLVIIGDQDDENIQQAAILLTDEIPAANRVQIDGAAHFPNLEKPDAFYNAIRDFLERTAALDQEADLATGLGGAVEHKLVSPEPVDR